IYRLLSGEEQARKFPDWSMAFLSMESEKLLATLPGYSDYLHQPMTEPGPWIRADSCQKLIHQFKQNNVFG
ncbi:MAG: hypothetical protein ACR2HF_14115, partial [Methylococcaceae bacterium]